MSQRYGKQSCSLKKIQNDCSSSDVYSPHISSSPSGKRHKKTCLRQQYYHHLSPLPLLLGWPQIRRKLSKRGSIDLNGGGEKYRHKFGYRSQFAWGASRQLFSLRRVFGSLRCRSPKYGCIPSTVFFFQNGPPLINSKFVSAVGKKGKFFIYFLALSSQDLFEDK